MLKFVVFLVVFFGLSVSVDSACDFSHAICTSASLVCPNPSTTITVGNSSYGLIDIDVVVFGSITLRSGDIQGRTAARNNFYGQGGISVGDLLNDGLAYSLIVGGDLNVVGGFAVYPLSQRVFVGGDASTPSYVGTIDHCSSGSGCLNSYYDSLQSYWTQFSNLLNSQTDTATFSLSGGIATLTCQPSSSNNYFVHISASDFNQIMDYTTSGCSSTANWIFNIFGGDVRIQGNGIQSPRSYLVYNMVNVPQVSVASTAYANIVAPSSNIDVLSGDIDGALIAANITNLIEVNIPIYSSSSRAIPSNCPGASSTSTSTASGGAGNDTVTGTSTASGSASGGASNDTVSGTSTASGSASGTITASGTSTETGTSTESGGAGNGVSGAATSTSEPSSVIGPASNTQGLTSVSGITSDAASIIPFAFATIALISLI